MSPIISLSWENLTPSIPLILFSALFFVPFMEKPGKCLPFYFHYHFVAATSQNCHRRVMNFFRFPLQQAFYDYEFFPFLLHLPPKHPFPKISVSFYFLFKISFFPIFFSFTVSISIEI